MLASVTLCDFFHVLVDVRPSEPVERTPEAVGPEGPRCLRGGDEQKCYTDGDGAPRPAQR